MSMSQKCGLIFAANLMLICRANAAQNAREEKAVLEGYVRDDSGKPLKGVQITVYQSFWTTKGETTMIPIITPNAAGAVVINDPNAIKGHYGEKHSAKTNGKGHYRFKALPPGFYSFGITRMPDHVHAFQKYDFEKIDPANLTSGKTVEKDVILKRRPGYGTEGHRFRQ